jgi:predicted P-loop ATPase
LRTSLIFARSTDAYADFVNQQKWEGNLQLETVPMVFWGAADNIYSREIFRKMMVGACRRARYPGAKHDDILVLAGKGDLQKSLFVEAVSPFPEWYADFDMSWSGKERVENTMGLAVVEWAEMGGKRLRDDDHHKVTGSKRKDHVRLAWRYDPEIILTRHIIMATTNETGEFLTDPTGNRRYHPFEITNVIDVESFKIIQPQLWAEAAHLEERGYPNYLSKEAKALATANQEARQFKNNYITVLAEELNSICGWITLTGPWYLLGFRDKELNNRFEGQRVADAMSRLGWGRSQHDFKRGQGKVRCWHKPSQFGIPERCYRVTLDEDNRHPVVVQI